MQGIANYLASFITFTVNDRSNTARIQVDARCEVTAPGGEVREWLLGTPCQGEAMYLEVGLVQQPTFLFCGLWSRDDYSLMRWFAEHDPRREHECTVGRNDERFADVRLDIMHLPSVRELKDDIEVITATLKNRVLVARTHLQDRAGQWKVVLEYPVKTMNVAPETERFQVDTGPLLVPLWSLPSIADETPHLHPRSLVPSFIVYNNWHQAEFILLRPTAVPGSPSQVMHYSDVRLSHVRNEIWEAI